MPSKNFCQDLIPEYRYDFEAQSKNMDVVPTNIFTTKKRENCFYSKPEHSQRISSKKDLNLGCLFFEKYITFPEFSFRKPRGTSLLKPAYVTFVILKSHDFCLRFWCNLSVKSLSFLMKLQQSFCSQNLILSF